MGVIESKLIPNGPITHMIPQDWKVERMEHIAQILGGGTPDTTIEKYWNGEILWATPTDIVPMDGKQLETTLRMITKAGLGNSSARLIPAKSIIVCTRASIGELVITTHDTSFNQGNTGIIPNESINYEFLAYFLKTLVSRMKNLASGSTFLELSKRDFRSLKVFLPPLPEQFKIAVILSSVDEAIDKTQVVIAKTERLKKGVMQQLLTRGMPGWHSEWKEEKVLYSKYFVAKCWTVKKIKDITNVVSGKTPLRNIAAYYGDGSPWIKTTDLNGNTVTNTTEEITSLAVNEVKMKLIPKNTVMIAMYGGPGTVGKSAYTGIDAYTNQSIAAILPNSSKFHFKFLHYLILYMRPYWMNISASSRKDPNITKGDVNDLVIPFPPLEEQTKIVSVLDAVDEKIQSLKSDLCKQKQIKKGVMQQLLTGKIRVNINSIYEAYTNL